MSVSRFVIVIGCAALMVTPMHARQRGGTPDTEKVQPVNSGANPYRVIRDWAQLTTEARPWGGSNGVAIDRDGRSVWAVDRCGPGSTPGCVGSKANPVHLFDASGKEVRSFGAGMFAWPHGIHVDRDGNVWVADARAPSAEELQKAGEAPKGSVVVKFSPEGKVLLTLGKPGVKGNPPEALTEPTDVVTDPANGDVYVAESHTNVADPNLVGRISVFDRNGRFLRVIGRTGTGPGEFRTPHALEFDSQGRLVVADRHNHRVQVLTKEGKFIREYHEFSRVSGLAIDRNDVIYTADSESTERSHPGWRKGIRIGSLKDGKVTTFVPPHMTPGSAEENMGEGIAIDAAGNIYTAEAQLRGIAKYVRDGQTAFAPVTDAVLTNPDPADWLHISRTYDQQRFSPLKQITKDNVAQLRMAWSRGLPAGVQESTPVVYRGVMYVMAPGGRIQALDATNGDLIWEYRRDYAAGVAAAAARSKNLGIYEDMIYFGAPDGYLLALDAATGKLRWETKVDNGQITAGGLLVADGKVISNRTCTQGKREFCFIAAHDARTGKEVWRFYVTAAPGEPGGDTWGKVPADARAAGPWGLPGSYDPVRKIVYWGVANPNPYTRFKRHGRYDEVAPTSPAELYSNSTLALDVQTGKLAWYFQELPGDDWDADHNQERLLIRTRVAPDPRFVKWINPTAKSGAVQDVVITVAEGGGMFAVARDTGQFLWARPFPFDDPNVNVDVVDVRTGKTAANPKKLFTRDRDKIIGCYHNTRGLWQIAYHPGKNAIYVPFHDQCLSMEAVNESTTGFGERTGVIRPGSDPKKYMNIGRIDVATGELRVIYSQPQATNGSALVTAGDLVFFGDLNRRLRALDADSGKVLWETIVGGMIVNSTITYAVNGRQYVMVYTGGGQSVTSGPLALTAAAMPPAVTGHNAVYVFALP